MDQKLVEIIGQLQAAAPAATAQAMQAVWVEGIINLLTCLMGIAAAYGFGRTAASLYAAHRSVKGPGDFTAPGISSMATGFIAFCLIMAATFGLLSTSTWMAVIDPQAALAVKVINAISKH